MNNIFFNNCRNYRAPCNSSLVSQILSPCDILNQYLIDPCSIFNGTIIPAPPIPQPLPPIPPMPPLPPGPLRGFGEFRAPIQQLDSGDFYVFNTVAIQGNEIEHMDGTTQILLTPNTTYQFNYITDTVLAVNSAGIAIVFDLNGVHLQNTVTEVDNIIAGVPVMTQANGQFMTGNNPGILQVRFISQPGNIGSTNATLTLIVV